MGEAALVVSVCNLFFLLGLWGEMRRIREPITRKARAELDAAVAAAGKARAEYERKVARRRDDKDRRQIAAERAMDAMRARESHERQPPA